MARVRRRALAERRYPERGRRARSTAAPRCLRSSPRTIASLHRPRAARCPEGRLHIRRATDQLRVVLQRNLPAEGAPRTLGAGARHCAPKAGKPAPYEDTYDESTGRFTYRFRDPGSESPQATLLAAADNRKLIEAYQRGVPVIYFRGIAPGQYTPIAPVFVTAIDDGTRTAALEVGLPLADTSPDGLVSNEDTRRYATRDAAYRLHQHRFRRAVLQAYRTRCTVCAQGSVAAAGRAHR